MNEKRYYWLKLEENYFDLKVQKALRKLPSGADMLICYLKMQLKYLNTGGIIEFNNICPTITEEIALDIDEDIELVGMTIAVLAKWNVVEIEDKQLYISEMQQRIGSKSDSALRVAKYREKQKMLQSNNDVTKCNSIKDIEKDKEIEIEKDIYNIIEEELSMTLSPMNYELIHQLIDMYGQDKLLEAVKIASNANKKSLNYVTGILKNNITKNNNKTPSCLVEAKREEIGKEELEELEDMFKEFK